MHDEGALRCDGCAGESWPDGALVLVVQREQALRTVMEVQVSCGAACSSPVAVDEAAVVQAFGAIGDVFDYADRILGSHDWERGTVQRLSRVLAAVHKRRA